MHCATASAALPSLHQCVYVCWCVCVCVFVGMHMCICPSLPSLFFCWPEPTCISFLAWDPNGCVCSLLCVALRVCVHCSDVILFREGKQSAAHLRHLMCTATVAPLLFTLISQHKQIVAAKWVLREGRASLNWKKWRRRGGMKERWHCVTESKKGVRQQYLKPAHWYFILNEGKHAEWPCLAL